MHRNNKKELEAWSSLFKQITDSGKVKKTSNKNIKEGKKPNGNSKEKCI